MLQLLKLEHPRTRARQESRPRLPQLEKSLYSNKVKEAKTELLAHRLILMKCQVHKLLYRNSPTANFFYDDLET